MRKRTSIAVRFSSGIFQQDWQPMERHPRPLKRRNPNEMGRAPDRVVNAPLRPWQAEPDPATDILRRSSSQYL